MCHLYLLQIFSTRVQKWNVQSILWWARRRSHFDISFWYCSILHLSSTIKIAPQSFECLRHRPRAWFIARKAWKLFHLGSLYLRLNVFSDWFLCKYQTRKILSKDATVKTIILKKSIFIVITLYYGGNLFRNKSWDPRHFTDEKVPFVICLTPNLEIF